jgi:hypothetical protein
VSVVRQLLDAGLLDELHLFVDPAIAGSGLFDDGVAQQLLKLLLATPFKTGVLHLVYDPDPDPPVGTYDDAINANRGRLASDGSTLWHVRSDRRPI